MARRYRLVPARVEAAPGTELQPCAVSFVVPAFQAAATLRDSIESIRRAAPADCEVIVVDDGSLDSTYDLAVELADVVVRRSCQAGAARARNDGIRVARGDIICFVDSDVTVTREAVAGLLARVHEGFDAVFGAYEALPPPDARSTTTNFKNILHHYTHLQNAGEVRTFWSGFGAVRRQTLLAVGGFDINVTKAADVEDIHLGYRLHAAGFRIFLDPTLQARHHKRYSLRGLLSSDVMHRAVPWTRAMMRLRVLGTDMNLRRTALPSMVLAPAAVAALALAPAFGWRAVVLSAASLAGWLVANRRFLGYVWRQWSVGGAAASAALLFLFYIYGPPGAVAGVVAQLVRKGRVARISWLDAEPQDADDSSVDVTVALIDYHGQLAATVAALPPPAPWWELIVVGPYEPSELPAGATYVWAPGDWSVCELAQRALDVACGEMFAVLDASMVPEPGWLDRVRAAAHRSELFIGGSFAPDRSDAIARAHQVSRYWTWRPERSPAWLADHPFTNLAVRTDVARTLQFTRALILRLTRFGARPVRFDPEMCVRAIARPPIATFLRVEAGESRFRASAAVRYYDIGRVQRLASIALAPALALRMLGRIVRSSVREGSVDRAFVMALPLTAVGVASHWAGRVVGLAAPAAHGGIPIRTPSELLEVISLQPRIPVAEAVSPAARRVRRS